MILSNNRYSMLKVWLYELVTFVSFGVSLTMINDVLQTVVLIIGIVSGILALRQSIKNKKN